MLCSRFLKPPSAKKHGALYRASESVFDGMLRPLRLDPARSCCTHKFVIIMLVASALVVATGYWFQRIPKGFIPDEDTGQIFGFTEAAQDISFDSMVKHQQAVAKILTDDPNIFTLSSSAGASQYGAGNTGRVFARLKASRRASPRRSRSSKSCARSSTADSRASASTCRIRRSSASAAS